MKSPRAAMSTTATWTGWTACAACVCRPRQPGVRSNYAYFPVVFAGGRTVRDAVCEALDREGVYARKYFYPLVTDFECYRGRAGFDTSRVPVARRVSDGVVTLPLYPELSDAQVDLICRVVREELRHA